MLLLGAALAVYGASLLAMTATAGRTGRAETLTVQGCSRTKNSHVCYASDSRPGVGQAERLKLHRLVGDHHVHVLDQVPVHFLPGRDGWAFVDGGWGYARALLALAAGAGMCVWAWGGWLLR